MGTVTINETLKWLSFSAHLNARVIPVVTVYRKVYNLPLPPPPYHPSPSLISLVVSVDVKHQVYLELLGLVFSSLVAWRGSVVVVKPCICEVDSSACTPLLSKHKALSPGQVGSHTNVEGVCQLLFLRLSAAVR